MTKRVFIDTSWSPRKKNSKKPTCYDPEKDEFFEVEDLRELRGYDEIYLDSSIFPNMWVQLRPLIYDGVKVYYFTRPWKWKEIRERFKEDLKAKIGRVTKTDRGDAYLLWKVYELSLVKGNTHRYFRELTLIDVELRPLFMKEGMLYKNLQRVQNADLIGIDVGGNAKMLEEMIRDVRREVVDKTVKLTPRFIDIAKGLGLSINDVHGLFGLAGLLTYFRFKSYTKSKNYLGIFKALGKDGNKKKRCNSKARRYLQILCQSIMKKEIVKFREQRTILKNLMSVLKGLELAGVEGLG